MKDFIVRSKNSKGLSVIVGCERGYQSQKEAEATAAAYSTDETWGFRAVVKRLSFDKTGMVITREEPVCVFEHGEIATQAHLSEPVGLVNIDAPASTLGS